MANVEIDGVNSKVYTDQVDPKTGTTLTLGTSGDTVSIPSGVTIANSGTATGFGAALTGSTNNTVTTVTAANAISGETNLTFDGTDLTVATGNVVIGTAGKGIDFSAQTGTAASGAATTDEVLDHYEEGTWTPVWNNAGGSMTLTYTKQIGKYTRIGRQVFIHCTLNTSAMSGSPSSNLSLEGFPFTNGESATDQYFPIVSSSGFDAAADRPSRMYLNRSAVTAGMNAWTDDDPRNGMDINIEASDLQDGANNVIFSFDYEVA